MSLENAWNIMFNEFQSIIPENGEWKDSPFKSNYPNPEEIIMLKQEFERLSNEAREVISILSNPSYIVQQELSTPKKTDVTFRSLYIYLCKSGWPKKRIRKVFFELRRFVSCL